MSDDQDQDILEAGDLDAEGGLDDFETGKTSFADAWKTNPMVKIGVTAGALAVIVGGVMLFGGDSSKVAPSTVMATGTQQSVKQPPGTKVSEVYKNAVEEVNEQNTEKAIAANESVIPIPIGPARGKVEVDGTKEGGEDPLERWRRIQEERLKKEQQVAKVEPTNVPAAPEQRPVDPYAAEKQALSQSMQTQMQSVLQSQDRAAMKSVSITGEEYMQKVREAQAQAEQAKQEAVQQAEQKQEAIENPVKILIEAGRIEYAQMITEANSDVPGPIIAELASGPLVGSRMIGSFTKKDEYLTLNFNTVVVEGKSIGIDALALDPKTALPGVVTEVDHKYFKRVILPAAAAFIEGIGGAIADNGGTTISAGVGTTVSQQNSLDAKQQFFKGVEKASSKMGQVLEQDAGSVQPMVRVASGTHIGVMFTREVTETPEGGPQVATTAPPLSPGANRYMSAQQPTTPQGQIMQAVQNQFQPQPANAQTTGR